MIKNAFKVTSVIDSDEKVHPCELTLYFCIRLPSFILLMCGLTIHFVAQDLQKMLERLHLPHYHGVHEKLNLH